MGVHMQGRMQLMKRTRLGALVSLLNGTALDGCHLSPTSTACNHSFDYVMKLPGRVAGPWRLDVPLPAPMPRELKDWVPRPWQVSVADICKEYDPRVINVIVDTHGRRGKGMCGTWLGYTGVAVCPNATNKALELMAAVLKFPAKAYVFDCPKKFFDNPKKGPPKRMDEFWTGIEQIKDGKAYDPRYEPRMEQRDRPVVWVFTNQMPNLKDLIADRWKLWLIDLEERLVLYTPEREVKINVGLDMIDGMAKKRKRPQEDFSEVDSMSIEDIVAKYTQ